MTVQGGWTGRGNDSCAISNNARGYVSVLVPEKVSDERL